MESNRIIHKGDKFTYYLGQTINDKTIISDKICKLSSSNKNVFHVKVRCKCGLEMTVQIGQLTCRKACRSCSIEKRGFSYKDICSDFYNKVKNNAKDRGIEFLITPVDIYNQYVAQDKKCALTGMPLKFTQRRLRKKEQISKHIKQERGTASIDRIDSNKGYNIDNIQIVHKHINVMKLDHTMEYFINLCNKVTLYSKSKELKAIREGK